MPHAAPASHASHAYTGAAGGDAGGDGGGGGGSIRRPQSAQSLPRGHSANSAPGPASSHRPSYA